MPYNPTSSTPLKKKSTLIPYERDDSETMRVRWSEPMMMTMLVGVIDDDDDYDDDESR